MLSGAVRLLLVVSVCGVWGTGAASDPPSWGSAAFPIVMAHRGGAIVRPENTFAAFDYSAALDGVAIETDVTITADGIPVLMHDPDASRTTGVAGEVARMPFSTVQQLDASWGVRNVLPGFGFQPVPTFDEYLRRYGREHLLIPEVKANSPDLATRMAQLIVRYGLEESVLVQSFVPDRLLDVKAVSPRIRTAIVSDAPVPVDLATANGAWAVFVWSGSIDAPYVASMHAAGLRVFAWTVNVLEEADRLVAIGVDAIATDHPAYVGLAVARTPSGTTVTGVPPERLRDSGWRTYASIPAQPLSGGGILGFQVSSLTHNGNYFEIQPPLRTPDTLATQTVETTLHVLAARTDLSRWLGVHFCWSRDDNLDWQGGGNGATGYLFAYRRSGRVELTRIVAGFPRTLASAQWPPLQVGDAIPLRIELTGTTVTVTLTTTGQTVSAADAAVARGGLWAAVASGVVPALGTTTLIY